MAPKDVTVVFVPGAWHSPKGYGAVIKHLEEAGYNTAQVWTPSVVRPGAQAITSIEPDVEETRKHISQAVDQGQQVVLVLHSYAGQVGSFAAKGFDQASLAAQGHTDGRGIVHVVYIAALMLLAGQSLFDLQKERGPSDWVVPSDKVEGAVVAVNAGHVFYNDFESQEMIDEWTADLNPWSIGVAQNVLDNEPWKVIPTTYLACIQDNAIPIYDQKELIRKVQEAGPVDFKVVEWDCSHTPFGSRPLDTSNLIRSTVGDGIATSA